MPKYNRAKFLRLVKKDMFLKFIWDERQANTPKDQHASFLKAMFNSCVLEDSVMTREYEAA